MGTEALIKYIYVSKGLVTAAFGSSEPFYMESGRGMSPIPTYRVYRLSDDNTSVLLPN